MTERKIFLYIINLLLVLILSALALSFQTTVWFHFFGQFPSPNFWIVALIFFTLYRKPFEGIFIIYLICTLVVSYTSMPWGLTLFNGLIVFFFGQTFKGRIYIPGVIYFLLVSVVGVLTFHIAQYSLSAFFNDAPLFELFDRLLQIMLTPIAAFPIFYAYGWIDRLTGYEHLIETGTPYDPSTE